MNKQNDDYWKIIDITNSWSDFEETKMGQEAALCAACDAHGVTSDWYLDRVYSDCNYQNVLRDKINKHKEKTLQ